MNSSAANKIIAIDGRPFQGARTGVGRYVFELCKVLENELPDVTFRVYTNRPLNFEPFSPRWSICYEKNRILRRLKPAMWLKCCAGRMVNKDRATVFWGSASFLPYGLNSQIKRLLTVYDLNYLLVPETMSLTHRLSFHMFFSRDFRRADVVTAISEGTSERLRYFFGRGANGIVRPSADPLFFSRPCDADIAATKGKYGIKSPYFISVATPEPRKNISALIDGFTLLKEKVRGIAVSLVLVGGGGWKNEQLAQKISMSSDVCRLGFVPDADLPALYAGAIALVFPSRYEGFGMPVLEARLCGTKAIASDVPEIREAGGSDTVYINPTPAELAISMELVLKSDDGPVPLMFTTWAESGKLMTSIFSDLS